MISGATSSLPTFDISSQESKEALPLQIVKRLDINRFGLVPEFSLYKPDLPMVSLP